MNNALHYLSNFLETNLKKKNKAGNPKDGRIRNHLIQVCRANTLIDLTIEGSYLEYKSLFVNVVQVGESYGFLIDSLMPRDGNYRMNPNTAVTLSYSYGEMRFKFNTVVLREVRTEFPGYLLQLPTAIRSNDKRVFYRMPTTVLKPLTLDRVGDPIRTNVIRKSRVLNFTSEGLCIELPAVGQLTEGKRYIRELLQQIRIRLPDSSVTHPINATCCYLRPSLTSNGFICGIKFDDISLIDKNRLDNLYYERQRDVRVA